MKHFTKQPITYAYCMHLFKDVKADIVLRQFGEYFFEFCKRSGYDHMLRTLGGNLFEFIENLDALHGYLSLSYKVASNLCVNDGLRVSCCKANVRFNRITGIKLPDMLISFLRR